jgi:hypothetical protein
MIRSVRISFSPPSMILILLSFAVLASAALQRRSSNASQPFFSLPLTFSESGQYVVGMKIVCSGISLQVHVVLTLGPQGSNQSFGMAISTSTGGFVVAGTNCSSCAGVPLSVPNQSSTSIPFCLTFFQIQPV